MLLHFHKTNSSFFSAILRFEAAPSIVVSSIAFVARGCIGRTISSVMRRCAEFAFHYSLRVFVFGYSRVYRWLCLPYSVDATRLIMCSWGDEDFRLFLRLFRDSA